MNKLYKKTNRMKGENVRKPKSGTERPTKVNQTTLTRTTRKRKSCESLDRVKVTPPPPLQVLANAAAEISGSSKRIKATAIPTPTRKSEKAPQFFLRTSPKGLHDLVRELSDTQKDAVKSIGFGSLLSLGISACPVQMSRHLLTNFDPRRRALILKTGELLPMDEEDVECVLNLPRGDIEISESNGKSSDSPDYLEMLRTWRTRWVGNPTRGAPLTVSMPVRIKANKEADDDFKRDFVVYVVSSFLWTTQNSQCRFKVLKSLIDVDRIKELNWCKFTLDGLVDSVEKWQENTSSYFYGPLTFLLVIVLFIRLLTFLFNRHIRAVVFFSYATWTG